MQGFVVATRRTRTAGKVDIPSIDDHVSKLEHMGKETVRKLQDIAAAAQQVGIEIDIPENCVQRVGDFKALALRAEQDGHLRQRLQHVLKLRCGAGYPARSGAGAWVQLACPAQLRLGSTECTRLL